MAPAKGMEIHTALRSSSLVTVAHSAGHSADHVSHRGLGGLKDWQLMRVIRQQEYTFVTNNV